MVEKTNSMEGEDCPRFSVVIVTRNRAAMLAVAIRAVLDMHDVVGSFEVVVVDNGSSDGTPALLAELTAQNPRRVVSVNEPQPGISRARNKGIRASRGDWLLFLDDDAQAPLDLLSSYTHWIEAYPCVSAWGGGATLQHPDKLPWCWGPHFDGMLSALDLGDEPRILTFPETPYGLNMLIGRKTLDQLGGFRNEIAFGGDETDLFLRMSQAGLEVRYAPGCTVLHAVEAGRFSLNWLLAASFRSGRYHATLDRLNGGLRVGWEMVSSGWVKVIMGRRGCVPIALAMHVLRVAGYLLTGRRASNVDD